MKVSLNTIIKKGQKQGQLIVAFVGSVIGLLMLIGVVQLYMDYTSLFEEGEDFLQDGYMIEKQVNAANTISGKKASYTQEELDELKSLDFIEDLAPVKTSNYKVNISGGDEIKKLLGGADFSLLFFFQSLPDKFVKIKNDDFKWLEGDSIIPIVVPADYLNLFNNGFASSQNVRQLSGDLIQKLTVNIEISGQDKKTQFKGKIIDFNGKINSILVPESFMDYAKEKYGNPDEESMNRVFVVTKSKDHNKLAALIKKRGFVVNENKMEVGKQKIYVQIIMSVLLFIGFVILVLAALNFILYSQLSIYKNEYEIGVLTQIGYDYKTVSWTYIRHFAILFGLIALTTFVLAIFGKMYLNYWIGNSFQVELSGSLSIYAYLVGVVFLIAYVTLNSYSIRSTIKKIALKN